MLTSYSVYAGINYIQMCLCPIYIKCASNIHKKGSSMFIYMLKGWFVTPFLCVCGCVCLLLLLTLGDYLLFKVL